MTEPRGQVIRRYARDTQMPDPESATYPRLRDHIQGLSPGWVHPDDLLEKLNAELDGARPVA